MSEKMVEELNQRFELSEHEVRKGGGGQWFVYLQKQAIIKRLDMVAPMNWQTKIVTSKRIDDRVEVIMEMTIGEITRAYDGVAEDNRNKAGELFPLNTTKAANTDAFKRVASMFGVGLYLLDCPIIKASNEKSAFDIFANWYNGDLKLPSAKQNGNVPTPVSKHKPWHPNDIQKFEDSVAARFPGSLAMVAMARQHFKIEQWSELGLQVDVVPKLYGYLYGKCQAVLVERMRYVIEGKQKYFEFSVDENSKSHSTIRAYGRSTTIKNEWLGEFAYHMLGWDNFDDIAKTTEWADIEATLVIHYERNDYDTLIATGMGHNIVDPQVEESTIPF